MAIFYWNNWSDSTTTSGSASWYSVDATSSTSTAFDFNTYPPPPRRVIVKHPPHWDKKTTEAYVRLVNQDTKTGWRVTMLISGDLVIVDPTIDVRSMAGFVPLLKMRASDEDKAKIETFFERHGIGDVPE